MRLFFNGGYIAHSLIMRRIRSSLTILLSTLSLLHFLAFPSPHPATHEPRPGLELAARLQQAATFREFDGVHEAFISAVGRISYADIDLEFASSQGWEAKQLEGLQCEQTRALRLRRAR